MKKLIMLAVGLIAAQTMNAQNDGYITWDAINPECTINCPNSGDVSSSKFVFTKITNNAPVNQIYGWLGTFTHNKVKKVEFTFARAMKTTKCGNQSTDVNVMLTNIGGKFEIKTNMNAAANPSVNATVAAPTGTIVFSGAGCDLWTSNTNLTILTMKPDFSVLPAIPAGCTETYTIPVTFRLTFANGCTSQAVYLNQIKIKRQ